MLILLNKRSDESNNQLSNQKEKKTIKNKEPHSNMGTVDNFLLELKRAGLWGELTSQKETELSLSQKGLK